MSTDVNAGSRSLKSMNSLISTTLVLAILAALAAGAGYFLDMNLLYLVAAGLALTAIIPSMLMFQRVRAVEADISHREALSMAQRKETERNQQAILRLLDELAPLADGDLTVQATVTEDITGTIADSINYAIGVLRDLVSTINQSAIQLDGATRQTQALSAHLTKAASAQSKRPLGTGSAAASPRRKSTRRSSRSSRARRRAAASSTRLLSTPVTRPRGPTITAASRVTTPLPQPTSTTRHPGAMPQKRRNRRRRRAWVGVRPRDSIMRT